MDEAGEVVNHYGYDAWGKLTEREERVPNRFAFGGEQLDPLTRQYYLRARYYNPVYYVDPSGHQPKCVKSTAAKGMEAGESLQEAYRNAYKKHGEDKLSDSSNLSAGSDIGWSRGPRGWEWK